jgi:hypothetical protein
MEPLDLWIRISNKGRTNNTKVVDGTKKKSGGL